MVKNFIEYMNLERKTEEEVRFIPPLVLAYIGDAIYEVYIRTYILHKYGGNVNQLHKVATKFVKAGAQAHVAHELEKELNEEEWTILKRGRNQKSGSMPKNASVADYKYATGFETLVGHLYLLKRTERLEEIIKKSIELIEKNDESK
ncbi:ribonuclease III domain-containing protein [Clostridiaceae bacterium 35-E11]